MKVYEAGQISEEERLAAVALLASHNMGADDVYRLEVGDDKMVVFRYQTPLALKANVTAARFPSVDDPAVRPPLEVAL